MINEHGEIRAQVLALSKRLEHLQQPLQLMQASLAANGHSPPAMMFIDNIKAEASFFEAAIPSLGRNVRHIPPPSVDGLPAAALPEGYQCHYIRNREEIEQACNAILRRMEREQAVSQKKELWACGFDTEHSCSMDRGVARGQTALIQLAFETEVFVFQVSRFRWLASN